MPDPGSAARKTNPRQWWLNLAYNGVASIVAIAVGTCIFAAIYYITTQWSGAINHYWHLVPTDARHTIRAVWEGYYAGLAQQFITFNYFRKRGPLRWRDRLEIAVGIPNLKDSKELSLPGFALGWWVIGPLFAIPAGVLAYFGAHALADTATVQHFEQWLQHLPMAGAWTENWEYKVVGFAASRLGGRRVPLALFADAHERLARLLVLHTSHRWYNTPRWIGWLPPRFVSLYRWEARQFHQGNRVIEPSRLKRFNTLVILGSSGLLSLALFLYGLSILTSLAP
jgi:hypothetical protein